MRVAAIDVGTNTVLLLVAEHVNGSIVAVEERAEIVRLGEGLDRTGRLAEAAMERTLAVIDRVCAAHRGARLRACVGGGDGGGAQSGERRRVRERSRRQSWSRPAAR